MVCAAATPVRPRHHAVRAGFPGFSASDAAENERLPPPCPGAYVSGDSIFAKFRAHPPCAPRTRYFGVELSAKIAGPSIQPHFALSWRGFQRFSRARRHTVLQLTARLHCERLSNSHAAGASRILAPRVARGPRRQGSSTPRKFPNYSLGCGVPHGGVEATGQWRIASTSMSHRAHGYITLGGGNASRSSPTA